MERLIGCLGIFTFIGIGYLLSEKRGKIKYKTLIWGLSLQVVLALLILGIPALGIPGVLRPLFNFANVIFVEILNFTNEGSAFLFGPLTDVPKIGFVFAIQVLPTIVFFSSLMGVFYHWGIMQKLVKVLAIIMHKTMRVSGAESLSAAANIFVGQTEAPLIVRPYIEKMTRSEIMALMTGGMATVAGGVMAAYVGLLISRIPEIAGHLLTASVMSAPAALVLAKLIIPETEKPETLSEVPKDNIEKSVNVIEAAAKGAGEGLKLALNVGAMLLAFIALIAMVNAFFGFVGSSIGFSSWGQQLVPDLLLKDGTPELTFQIILGWFFAPFAWIMGVPWSEATVAGSLLGEKIVLNEFVAYAHLAEISNQLSDRTVVILSYALSGFANFSSIAIQIGGIGTIAPNRRTDLASLGIRAVIGGSLAAFMTASIAGLLF